MKNSDNKIKKNWKILLLLSSFSALILAFIISVVWFFGYRTVGHTFSLNYKGHHYYSTAYIQPKEKKPPYLAELHILGTIKTKR